MCVKCCELGDFFAGVFAPVAFLWLILGYAQQGDELGLTRKEVERQATALESTNLQQKILAQTAEETHRLDMEGWQRRNNIANRQTQPCFVDFTSTLLDSGQPVAGTSQARLIIDVRNIGESCRLFYAELLQADLNVSLVSPSVRKPKISSRRIQKTR